MPGLNQGKKIALGVAAMLALASAPAHAAVQSTDPLVEGAKACTRYLPRYEREYAIPTHLLSAIASTESGRYHEGLKIRLPWPWTINVEGKGYYFNTKADAIMAVRKFQMRGIQSIDVGCMQVNLMHHPHAFRSLEEAFEPAYNEAYAAGFLRNLYQENGSWKKAAANYHSRNAWRGTEYVSQVYDSWYKIVEKLREAKIQSSAYAAAEPAAPVHVPQPLPEQIGRDVAPHQTPRMNSISVHRPATRDNSVMLVKADTASVSPSRPTVSAPVAATVAPISKTTVAPVTATVAPVAATVAPVAVSIAPVGGVVAPAIAPMIPAITVASARPSYTEAVPADTGSKIIRVTDQPSASRRSGPNFIFND